MKDSLRNLLKDKRTLYGIGLLSIIIGSMAAYLLFLEPTKSEESSLLDEARALKQDRHYSDALVKYKEAANEDPKLTYAYLEAADILGKKNKLDQAYDILEPGFDFANSPEKLYQEAAKIKAKEGDFSAALDMIDHATSTSSDSTYKADKAGYLVLNKKLEEANGEITKIEGDSADDKFRKAIASYTDLSEVQELAKEAYYSL